MGGGGRRRSTLGGSGGPHYPAHMASSAAKQVRPKKSAPQLRRATVATSGSAILSAAETAIIGMAGVGKQSLISAYESQDVELFGEDKPKHKPTMRASSYPQPPVVRKLTILEEYLDWKATIYPDSSELSEVIRTNPPAVPANFSVSVVLFVFSVANHDSFKYIDNELAQHFKELRDNKIPMMLVGTCTDLDAEVSTEEIEMLSDTYLVPYYPTSTSDLQSITSMFNSMLGHLAFKRLQYDRWTASASFLKDKAGVAVLRGSENLLRKSLQLCVPVPGKPVVDGWTLFHICAWAGNILCASIVLQCEPSAITCSDAKGYSPLHIASRMGHTTFVKFLITNGANVNTPDSFGQTASETSYTNISKLISTSQELMKRNQRLKTKTVDKVITENITILNLSNAKLSSIPEAILACSELIELNLSSNSIVHLTVDFTKLDKLKKLLLRKNRIQTIPEEISPLRKLQVLDVRYNRIAGISSAISSLQNLSMLLATHNSLEFLPVELASLPFLKVLDIYGNPLSTLPDEVIPKVGETTRELLTPLFRHLNNVTNTGSFENNRIKVMFVGDGNVGKT